MLHEVDPLTGGPFCGNDLLNRIYLANRPRGDHRDCFVCKKVKANRVKKKKADPEKVRLLHCAYDPLHRITHQEVKGGVTYCGANPTNFVRRKRKKRPTNFDFCEECERLKNDGCEGYR